MEEWQQERAELSERINALRAQGQCPTCYDLETGALFRNEEGLLYEDEQFKVVLERYPRMRGHTIIIYKPHREDIFELRDDESSDVMRMCLRVIHALKTGLGAEKVYLNTMYDGPRNHLHLQLFPRYAGEETGSKRFVLPRRRIEDAAQTAALIHASLV